MTVSLPEEIERQFTPADIKLHLALGLFLDDCVTFQSRERILPAFHRLTSCTNWGSGEFPFITMKPMRGRTWTAAQRGGKVMLVVSDTSPPRNRCDE